MRVLVTGSRSWTDSGTITTALNEVWWEWDFFDGNPFVLVHGQCPSGADLIADNFARYMRWDIEPHPADWSRFGKRAGFNRNIEMVDAGADVCLAFIRGQSRGAAHCAGLAEAAGIPVRRYLA